MPDYLNQEFDFNSHSLVSAYDELPLWSSYFGAVLLKEIPLKNNSMILDIGCGTGFPLIEIAQRSGGNSKVFGIDPWGAAIDRIKEKLRTMCINNVEAIEGYAEALPFEDNYFDLVVSNNGINNVAEPEKVMKEAARVLKKNGQMVFTVNLPGTMKEFYDVFRETLKRYSLKDELLNLEKHIASKRKSLQMNIDMVTGAGLKITKVINDEFQMRFTDGSTMLNYYFIKLAFMDSWKKLIQENLKEEFFIDLEQELNRIAKDNGELKLTIPFACFSCRKDI